MIRYFGEAIMNLNKRQNDILNYINNKPDCKRLEIEEYIGNYYDKTSKVTIIRDLDILLMSKLITKKGYARNVTYSPVIKNELFREYNTEEYFKKETDERHIKYSQFNFDIFNNLNNILTHDELTILEKINKQYRKKIHNLPPQILKKEFERLLIELSWKSSKIEGNTYSLLDTETLIKNNIEAKGHTKEESIMILNHKNSLNYIFENPDYYKTITLIKIEELHELLTQDLNVNKGLRKSPVGITGTNYKPIFNQHQIKDAMEELISIVNKNINPIEKALITVLMISYIQPFEDGNKRTGRILANAILHANDYCPLSYRSIDETEYKKAVIIFYETNSLAHFKNLFIEQFKFAVEQYF